MEEGAATAERLRASGEDALRVATRDTVLRMRETLRERLEAQVRRLAAKQLADHSPGVNALSCDACRGASRAGISFGYTN